MADWSGALCEALDEQEDNLAFACHLAPTMSGPMFEEHLGLILHWERVRHLEERFQGLTRDKISLRRNQTAQAKLNVERRMQLVLHTIDVTLYDLFGQHRIDCDRAAAAYKDLIEHLEEAGWDEFIFATTNYDRAAETALAMLGIPSNCGFNPQSGPTTVLGPAGLIANRKASTPIIHLHGAVGWYEQDEEVTDHGADRDFNPSLGRPVVLYPDSSKDPTKDEIVSQLWTEFYLGLELADLILVIGHSLHDPALVRALLDASKLEKTVAISALTVWEAERIESLIPRAGLVRWDFGPETDFYGSPYDFSNR
jgi:hypothetical protein